MAHVKGYNVNLLLKSGDRYGVIAASTSCDMNITANNADAAAKDDPGHGIFDNYEFTNYSWNMSNESFIVDIAFLAGLLDKVINGDATFDVQYQIGEDGYHELLTKKGNSIVSNLTVDAVNGEFAKVTMSMEGNGILNNGTYTNITTPAQVASRIKGKALMVATKIGGNWKTIACSTSHKLTIALTLADITDKDYNDNSVLKEVTGKSVTLNTENLIDGLSKTETSHGASIVNIYDAITNGTTLDMEFGYYPNSIGQEKHGNAAATKDGWGEGDTVLISGKFMCSSFSNSGTNNDNSTFSAEFKNKGAVTVAISKAATSEE